MNTYLGLQFLLEPNQVYFIRVKNVDVSIDYNMINERPQNHLPSHLASWIEWPSSRSSAGNVI